MATLLQSLKALFSPAPDPTAEEVARLDAILVEHVSGGPLDAPGFLTAITCATCTGVTSIHSRITLDYAEQLDRLAAGVWTCSQCATRAPAGSGVTVASAAARGRYGVGPGSADWVFRPTKEEATTEILARYERLLN